jgi:hypothetical protein
MADPRDDAIPLETELTAAAGSGQPDRRPRIPEPLPVRLIAVDDVRLPAPAGVEAKLDAFYVGLLEFQRVPGRPAYQADNFILRFEMDRDRPIPHESLRPQGIEVVSLAETEKKLIDEEIEYSRQRSLTPGQQSLLVLDPAGNWLEIEEMRLIR